MQIHWIKSIEEIKRFSEEEFEMFFILTLEQYNEKVVTDIFNALKKLTDEHFAVQFSINAYQRNFNTEEFALFSSLAKNLKSIRISLTFANQYKHDYSFEEILKADTTLDNFINKIKNPELSPFEKFLMIYDYLAAMPFSSNADETEYQCRDIISVINGNDPVCEGYAELLKYFCENVGIYSLIQYCDVGDESGETSHANNIVRIDDDKYDIHGLYYCDVTWDNCKGRKNNISTFDYCLIPLKYVKSIRIRIDLYQPFPVYYRNINALLDGSFQSFIGYNQSFEDEYTYEYEPGFLEKELGLNDLVKESYNYALDLFINKGKDIAHTFLEILKENEIPEDVYKPMNVKEGTSFPYLFACLIVKDDNRNYVERTLNYVSDNKDNWCQIFSPMIWPRSSIDNIYELLTAIIDFDFNELHLTLEEFDKIKRSVSDIPYDKYVVFKAVFDIVEKVRLFRCYKESLPLINQKFPIGEPISIDKYSDALCRIYQLDGLSEEEVHHKVEEVIRMTRECAATIFKNSATNCWKKGGEIKEEIDDEAQKMKRL